MSRDRLRRLAVCAAAARAKAPDAPELLGLTIGEKYEVSLLTRAAGLHVCPGNVQITRFTCSPFAPRCAAEGLHPPCQGLSCEVCAGLGRLNGYDRSRLVYLVRSGDEEPRPADPDSDFYRPRVHPEAPVYLERDLALRYRVGDNLPIPGIDRGADPCNPKAWHAYQAACLRGEHPDRLPGDIAQALALVVRRLCSLAELGEWAVDHGMAQLADLVTELQAEEKPCPS